MRRKSDRSVTESRNFLPPERFLSVESAIVLVLSPVILARGSGGEASTEGTEDADAKAAVDGAKMLRDSNPFIVVFLQEWGFSKSFSS